LDIHASRFQPLASASELKTQDTSGRLSQPELLQCDQVSVSLKTSRDISALGFPTCCKTWQEWVTERRGAWRQRVNAARRIKESASLSWPTARARDWKDTGDLSQTEYGMTLGRAAQMQSWPTPRTNDDASGRPNDGTARVGPNGQRYGINLSDKVLHGQAAPASSSSHGSRQGLWSTPKTGDNHATKHHPQRSDGGQPNLAWQMEKGEQWRTPTSFDWKNTDCSTQVYLSDQVEGRTSKQTDFPTPRTCDWKSSPNADSNIKRMEVGQATLAEFVHAKHKKGDLWSTPRTGATESSRPNNKGGIPLADQAKREQWATPQAHDAQGPKTPQQIAVMRAKGHGVKNLNEMACWGTPTARDHKSGRGNEDRQYKELTPMVERASTGKLNSQWVTQLMGLSLGWVSPSCPASVIKNWPRFVSGWSALTIAPMSCDSSAMELCPPPQSELSECLPLSWPTPMQMDHWMSNNPRTDGRQDQLPNAVAKYARQP
jgi:hypothetical protein